MSFRAKREILCGQELEKIRFLPAVEMTDESPSTFYEFVKFDGVVKSAFSRKNAKSAQKKHFLLIISLSVLCALA